MLTRQRSALAVAVLAGVAAPVLAQPVAVTLVAIEGQDIGDGLTLTAFGDVYVNTLGQPGFVYTRSDSTTKRGMWIGSGSVWHSDQLLPDTASGGEPTIGISDAGDFIYSPAFNGNDAVVTSHGKLLAEGDPIPALPDLVSRFNSRPRMAANGTAFWVCGINTSTGTNVGNAFLRCSNTADPGTMTSIFRTGDLIEGRAISTGTSIFNFDVSDDAAHWISSVDLDGTTNDDAIILVDLTTVAAREGQPTGDGDNWANFDDPVINTAGNYAFTGDTDAATASDGYIAYNGQIVLREGATIGGTVLFGNPLDIAIDNNNRIAFVWGPQTTSDRRRALYIGQAPDLASTAVMLLQLDQEVDVNDDGVADYTVSDMNIGAGPGMDLADTGPVYISVNLVAIGGGDELEAIIGIVPPGGAPACPSDWNDDGAVNSSDISAYLTAWLTSLQNGDLNADFNDDGGVNSSDISAFLTQWLADVTGGEC